MIGDELCDTCGRPWRRHARRAELASGSDDPCAAAWQRFVGGRSVDPVALLPLDPDPITEARRAEIAADFERAFGRKAGG